MKEEKKKEELSELVEYIMKNEEDVEKRRKEINGEMERYSEGNGSEGKKKKLGEMMEINERNWEEWRKR